MKVGFTGTQQGMTDRQVGAFVSCLYGWSFMSEFHHGDCVGADEQAHGFVYRQGIEGLAIVVHPPVDPKKRANCSDEVTTILPAKEYLQRNKDIVDACDLLVAAPRTPHEELRSGTWSTVRYARLKGVPVIVLDP